MHPTHASRRHARIVDGILHQPAPAPRPQSITTEIQQPARKHTCFFRRLLLSHQPPRLTISNPTNPMGFDQATRTFYAMVRRESVRMAAAPRTIQHAPPTSSCPGLSSHPVRRRSVPRARPPALPEVLTLIASHAGPAPHPPPTKPLPPCPGLSSHPVGGQTCPRAPPPALPKVITLVASKSASQPAVTVSPSSPRSSPSPRHRLHPADAWEVKARQLRRKLAGGAETQRELQGAVALLSRQVRGLARENALHKDRAAAARARTEVIGGSVEALVRHLTESLGLMGKCRAEMGELERTVGRLVAGGRAALRSPGTTTAAAGPGEHRASATPVGSALAAPPADGMSLAESQTSFELGPPESFPSPSCDVHDPDSDVEFKRLSQRSNAISAPISTQSLPPCDISTPTIQPLSPVSRVGFRQLAEDGASEVLPEMDTWAWSSILFSV